MMTEREFLSRARVGAHHMGRPLDAAIVPAEAFEAVIDFLRANGFHDAANVVSYLEQEFDDLETRLIAGVAAGKGGPS